MNQQEKQLKDKLIETKPWRAILKDNAKRKIKRKALCT
jgi:hypothetical protein